MKAKLANKNSGVTGAPKQLVHFEFEDAAGRHDLLRPVSAGPHSTEAGRSTQETAHSRQFSWSGRQLRYATLLTCKPKLYCQSGVNNHEYYSFRSGPRSRLGNSPQLTRPAVPAFLGSGKECASSRINSTQPNQTLIVIGESTSDATQECHWTSWWKTAGFSRHDERYTSNGRDGPSTGCSEQGHSRGGRKRADD